MIKKLLFLPEKIFHRFLGHQLDLDLKAYLLKGSFSSFLIQLCSMALNFIAGILLARVTGAEGYGIFVYAFTWLSVICTIAVFGMDDLLVREVSSLLSKNNLTGIFSIVRWSFLRTFYLSVFIGFILIAFIYLTDFFSLEEKTVFTVTAAAIPIYSITMILQSVQRGLHKVAAGQFAEKIMRPALLLLGVSSIFFLYEKVSPLTAVFFNVAAFTVALGMLFFQTRHLLFSGWKNKVVFFSKNLWWKGKNAKSSFYFFIATIMAIINVRADILMLGWMRAGADVGVYNAAARFSDFTAFGLLILTPVLAPSISRLFSANELDKLQQLVKKSAWANFIFAGSITAVLLVFGKSLLTVFGAEFSQGYVCMLLLCGGQMITTFAGPAGNVLLMTGFEKTAFYCGLAGTLTNIFLNLLLIPDYGINGAAAATAASMLVWNGLQTWFVRKKIKINSSLLG